MMREERIKCLPYYCRLAAVEDELNPELGDHEVQHRESPTLD